MITIDTRPPVRRRHVEPVPARTLWPSVLVLVLALISPQLDAASPCASTDGPQFRCWLLREHGT